jgi:uncharacterized 2Fe-2S/4Fe-4S cluster protein (DUF4445 family)
MMKTDPTPPASTVVFLPSGKKGVIAPGSTALEAAESLGVGIESICGGRQTCGKCLIEVEIGRFQKHGITSSPEHISSPETDEITYAQAHKIDLGEKRLSCAARVLGDLVIHVPEESRAHKQVIRKEASELTLDVRPAVRLAYVEVEPDSLGGLSDWDRLSMALEAQWGLADLALDPLLLSSLQTALREGDWRVTATIWQEMEVIRVEPGYVESLYGLAFDVGTTTIAGYLCDLRTGKVIATEAMMNPQIRFGEDLMSRVSYGMMEPQGVQKMHRAIIKALNDLATTAAEKAGIKAREICDLVLVGNTVMHHILIGIDPRELGGAPFTLAIRDAIDLRARDLKLTSVHPGSRAHILPCIAGHVGADNVGVLLAEQPHLDEKTSLIVDIGTNAEILLGTEKRMASASSPTGPAFEGAQITHGQRAAPGAIERVRIDPQTGVVRYRVIGQEPWSDEVQPGTLAPTGICGSGIIEAVAELFLAGLIDPGGLFTPDAPDRSPDVRQVSRTAELVIALDHESGTGRDIVVTQNDIRAIQLAKGALYAGVRLLMHHLDVEAVDRIKLAGAFGSYIDPRHAMILGMIPDCDLNQVRSIGNAAGDGARIALLNTDQRREASAAARSVEYVETAIEPDFQEYFVAAMAIPHANDAFPHLDGIIPHPSPGGQASPRARRRKTRT